MNTTETELRTQLNLETGKLVWKELERHFARGVVIKVSAELDLIEVAMCMINNDATHFAPWYESGKVARADIIDAEKWYKNSAEFWAVVVKPWVLVQEIGRQQ